ncbi:CBS domain-containing protein [Cystobacter fuscus]
MRELSEPVPVLTPDSTAWQALQEMGQRQMLRLPVTEDGVLVGMLSQEDILRGLELRELKESRRQGPWNLGGRGHESPT